MEITSTNIVQKFDQINLVSDSDDDSVVEVPVPVPCPVPQKKIEFVDLTDDDYSQDTLSCVLTEDDRIIEAFQNRTVNRIPRNIIETHKAHNNIITSLNWCIPKYSHLFLSASQDGYIKIWDLYQTYPVQGMRVNSGLMAAKWSLDGGQIIAGGLEKQAVIYDVQLGLKIVQYDVTNVVTSIQCHPNFEDVYLVGTKNAVFAYDLRVDTPYPVRVFVSKCKEVLDIQFLDEKNFISSNNIESLKSSNHNIIAWDFSSGEILSDKIYLDRYTCPILRVHPSDGTFIAQTTGNYIASFQKEQPYTMENKRYVGHKVANRSIECDISPDGCYIVTADLGGRLFFYNYYTANIVQVINKPRVPTNRVRWHPLLPCTLISSSYDGQIQIWK